MSEITRHSQLTIDSINYDKPVNQNNLYFGSMHYKNQPLLIQTPRMIFKEIKEDSSTKQKFLVVSVDPDDFSFYDLLVKLDDHNLSKTYKLSKDWFNKELPMDVLETMYRRITKPFKKGEIPEIHIKIPFHKQKIQSKVYDQSNSIINYEQLKEGCTILCIMHVKGLKFLKKDYYCDNYITQIKLCQGPTYSISDKCLIADDEFDEIDESMYDYEILDEEIIKNNKEKKELEQLINQLENKINLDQVELSTLKGKIEKLT